MLSDRTTEAAQGLIPIPKPTPLPAPTPLPTPSKIQDPIPIQHASVLPPFMGTAAASEVPVPALTKPLVTDQAPPSAMAGTTAGRGPQAVPPPRHMRSTAEIMGIPSPEVFWKGTTEVQTALPRPEDYWRGTTTVSQIYLPPPDEFWSK